MARSTRGLYKRGNTWWMTYQDAIGAQRFDSCKTTNKKEAEQRLMLSRKETLEGIVPAPAIKPIALDDLKQRSLAFVEHQWGVATKKTHFAYFTGFWRNPPIHTFIVDILDHYRALRLPEKVGPAIINREVVRQGVDRACAASGLMDFHFPDLRARPSRLGSLCEAFRSRDISRQP